MEPVFGRDMQSKSAGGVVSADALEQAGARVMFALAHRAASAVKEIAGDDCQSCVIIVKKAPDGPLVAIAGDTTPTAAAELVVRVGRLMTRAAPDTSTEMRSPGAPPDRVLS